ncbi:MAG: hypothetical protein RJB65_1497, partial [Actinomycetota bacterium]
TRTVVKCMTSVKVPHQAANSNGEDHQRRNQERSSDCRVASYATNLKTSRM